VVLAGSEHRGERPAIERRSRLDDLAITHNMPLCDKRSRRRRGRCRQFEKQCSVLPFSDDRADLQARGNGEQSGQGTHIFVRTPVRFKQAVERQVRMQERSCGGHVSSPNSRVETLNRVASVLH
jgi:hypothetical protein